MLANCAFPGLMTPGLLTPGLPLAGFSPSASGRLTLTAIAMRGTAGLVLPSSGTPLDGFTGVQFANNGLMMMVIWTGSSGACTVTQMFGVTVEQSPIAPVTVALGNSSSYMIGPWSPTDFTARDGSGMTRIDLSVTTGNSVSLYEVIPVS